MAISRGRELASQQSPNPAEVRKSIAALKKDAEHVRKCIKAGLRDYDSGQANIEEIFELIEQLEEKIECTD
jgi:DNA-binding NarL/FixJ family response regulator